MQPWCRGRLLRSHRWMWRRPPPPTSCSARWRSQGSGSGADPVGAGRVLGARAGGAAQSRKGSSASAMCQSRTERCRTSPPSPVEVRLSSDGGCDADPAAAMGASPAAPPLRILGPAVEQNGAVGFFNDGSPMSQPWMLPQCSDPTTCRGQNATPPGGFTNFIQPNLSQNC
ncbi:hypothetical protein PVAP13_5NG454600 [Panicum virgatum]|uniref:Uncharacterized protein n=1 Tax=Panicum virgatum TaxID=38727 RepID=A0A8T0RWJ3_PANVG|nr:hypothetical protein PVAP13_5NG454600 [Panicum virgatum]KAG2590943.1 hypothetical protein PVAP13_5NG454600 [Panicum virgatum]